MTENDPKGSQNDDKHKPLIPEIGRMHIIRIQVEEKEASSI